MSFSGDIRDDSPTPADAAGRRSAVAPARYRNESPEPAIEPTSSSESDGSMFATADEKRRLRRQNLQTKKRTKIVSHAAERQRRKPAGKKSSKKARRGSAGARSGSAKGRQPKQLRSPIAEDTISVDGIIFSGCDSMSKLGGPHLHTLKIPALFSSTGILSSVSFDNGYVQPTATELNLAVHALHAKPDMPAPSPEVIRAVADEV